MKHLTVVSDINYILFALALIESFTRSSIPLTIHFYCIDTSTYLKVLSLKHPCIVVYESSVLFKKSPFSILDKSPLYKLRQDDYKYFCWSLASVFTKHIMDTVNCDSVTYIDADIYFRHDIVNIFNAFGTADCGIFRHRQLDPAGSHKDGLFNVGVVYFKRSQKGIYLLNWWADAVLHKKYDQYATCGDQKYLEYFPTICSPSEIYIDNGIGHGAPWLWSVYDYSKFHEGKLIWNGEEQLHVFTHFSKFKYYLKERRFESIEFKPYNTVDSIPALYDHHMEYLDALIRVSKKVGMYDK